MRGESAWAGGAKSRKRVRSNFFIGGLYHKLEGVNLKRFETHLKTY